MTEWEAETSLLCGLPPYLAKRLELFQVFVGRNRGGGVSHVAATNNCFAESETKAASQMWQIN